jgi:hypothetical protein
MVTITLDEVIRKTLSKTGLPLHYYIKYLIIARDGLKELNFAILPSATTTKLTLDSKMEATLPNDFVGEVAVYKAEGDKMIELPHNYAVSSYNSATAFDVVESVSSTGSIFPLYADHFRSDVGRQFGQVFPRVNGYRIIPEINKIRIDNTSDLTEVYIKYVTLPQLVNNKTLIHPFIEPAIVAYINWQVAQYAGTNDMAFKKNEYYNQRRLAKSNLSRINIADILSSFRIYHNQSVKM